MFVISINKSHLFLVCLLVCVSAILFHSSWPISSNISTHMLSALRLVAKIFGFKTFNWFLKTSFLYTNQRAIWLRIEQPIKRL